MDREIRCECGYIARAGDDDEIVALARTHAHTVHDMDFSSEQLLALALPSLNDDGSNRVVSRRPAERNDKP